MSKLDKSLITTNSRELESKLEKILHSDLGDGTILSGLADYNENYCQDHIQAIKQTILKEVLEVLPEDKVYADTTLNMTAEEVCIDDGKIMGFNYCLSECKQKLEELLS